MIVNLRDVNSPTPKVLCNADEVLQPHQTVWMSNKELAAKLGRAWMHGCGSCGCAHGLQQEWPQMVEQSALFCDIVSFERWSDTMASAMHHQPKMCKARKNSATVGA